MYDYVCDIFVSKWGKKAGLVLSLTQKPGVWLQCCRHVPKIKVFLTETNSVIHTQPTPTLSLRNPVIHTNSLPFPKVFEHPDKHHKVQCLAKPPALALERSPLAGEAPGLI